jgi:hypothetical protein
MGIIAIACYRPKAGNDRKLLSVVRKNRPLLLSLNLITDRPSILMRSEGGTLLEIFEWKSKAAKSKAHKNPDVMTLWNLMLELGDIVKLSSISETKEVFANFKAI